MDKISKKEDNQGPNFGYSFENCRYCILGCGRDHSVFWGFLECDGHKSNRLELLQAQYERDKQPNGLPGVREQDRNDRRILEWQCNINGKVVKSCKLMATLSTESYLYPPPEVQEQISKKIKAEAKKETRGEAKGEKEGDLKLMS